MKHIKFIATGILFGIILTKSEIISWYRWQEMFRFESFHLYGILLTSVAVGALLVQLIRRYKIKDIAGKTIKYPAKHLSLPRYVFGGFVFGMGWALVGCPGAIYSLLGHGFSAILLVLISAVGGTFIYGVLRNRLPH